MRIFFFLFGTLRLSCTWSLSYDNRLLMDGDALIERNGDVVTKTERRTPESNLPFFAERNQINETELSNSTTTRPIGDPFMDLFELLKSPAADTSNKNTVQSDSTARKLQKLTTTTPQQAASVPMRIVESSQTVFFTYHSDSKCKNPFYDTYIPSYVSRGGQQQSLKLNTCLNQQNFNAKFACKIGKNKYTLFKKVFAPSDATCSTPLSTQKVSIHKHDYVCSRDTSGETGGYMQIHCGEDALLETTMPAMPYLSFPEVYSNPTCSDTGLKSADADTPPRRERHWLDVCTAHHKSRNGSQATDFVAALVHHYKLSVVSESPLKIKYSRFASNDPQCSVKKHEHIYTYPEASNPAVMPACLKDPQFSEYFYLNTLATMPQIMPKEPVEEGEHHQYLLVKQYADTELNCTSTPTFIQYQTLGVCKNGIAGFFETGRSVKEMASNSSLLLYKYNLTDCAGPFTVEARPLTSPDNRALGECIYKNPSTGNPGHVVYQLLNELPDTSYYGAAEFYFGRKQDPDDCEKGKKWTAAIIQPMTINSCIYDGSSYYDTYSKRVSTYVHFKKDACSSDGGSVRTDYFYEPTCTVSAPTITFYGDTGGENSSTLTIRGIKCTNMLSNKPCSYSDMVSGSVGISGTGPGAAGYISSNMNLAWPGMPYASWALYNYDCGFTPSNTTLPATATCSMSSMVNIPSNTLITATLQSSSSYITKFAQCTISKWHLYEYSGRAYNDSDFHTRGTCGTFKLTDTMAVTTFPDGQKYFPPTSGYVARSFYYSSSDDDVCLGNPSGLDIYKFGDCVVARTAVQGTAATSYRDLVSSNFIETHAYNTSTDCTGTYTKSGGGFSVLPLRIGICSSGIKDTFTKSRSALPTIAGGALSIYSVHPSNSTCSQNSNALIVSLSLRCYGNGITRNQNGDYNRGWTYSYYSRYTCSADRMDEFAYVDSACSTRNATATFFADTNGLLSQNLTIRGVRSALAKDLSKRYNPVFAGSYDYGTIVSTAAGTSGGILEGMSLSWAGKDPSLSVLLVQGSCSYYWNNPNSTDADTAACTLSTNVAIPANTLITGKYFYGTKLSSTTFEQCRDYDSGLKQEWYKISCGSFADGMARIS